MGGVVPPLRGVQPAPVAQITLAVIDPSTPEIDIVSHVSSADDPQILGPDIPTEGLSSTGSFFTRKTDPFNPLRVAKVLAEVQIGLDLTPVQLEQVYAFIKDHADCFALSVGEVFPVPGAVHHLNVPPGTTFSKKVHQRPWTPPQCQYMHTKIDEMLAADIIEQCEPSAVKCVSPTTLAQKAHDNTGLTLEELQHLVNDQCIAAGLEPIENLPLVQPLPLQILVQSPHRSGVSAKIMEN